MRYLILLIAVTAAPVQALDWKELIQQQYAAEQNTRQQQNQKYYNDQRYYQPQPPALTNELIKQESLKNQLIEQQIYKNPNWIDPHVPNYNQRPQPIFIID